MAKAPLIWLPLNGDLTNNGIAKNAGIVQNNGNYDYCGPTGKCFRTGAPSSSRGTIGSTFTSADMVKNGLECTIMGWVRFNKAEMQTIVNGLTVTDSAHNPTSVLIGSNRYGGFGLNINCPVSATGGDFSDVYIFGGVRTGNGSAYTSSTIPEYDKWIHYATVLKYTNKPAGVIQLYKNGILLSESPISNIDTNCNLSTITTTFGIANGSIYGGNGPSFVPSVWVSDARVYNEALSEKEIYDISKALHVHYPFNWESSSHGKNLIINGYGQNGADGWSSAPDTTNIPSSLNTAIKGSWYGGQILTPDYYVPIIKDHTYTLNVAVKQYGTATSTSYPSLRAWDYDKKEIMIYMTPDGFHATARTTLAQDLNPGDIVIHATDLSGWTGPAAVNNYYIYVAIFGYKNSAGYVYPDYTYTRDCPAFGSYSDKSHLNISNNTITLNSAYTGEPRKAGTTICASTAGSTYYYPWNGINPTTVTDWTIKSFTFIPTNINRFKNAAYIAYYAYSNLYHAGVELIDTTIANIDNYTVKDASGFNNNGTYSGGIPRYSTIPNTIKTGKTAAEIGPGNHQISIPTHAFKTDSGNTVSFWFKPINHVNTYDTLFVAGKGAGWNDEYFCFQRDNATTHYHFTLANGSSSTQNTIQTPNFTLGTWYFITCTYDYPNKKGTLYVNGEQVATKTNTFGIDFTTITGIYIGHNFGSYYPSNELISDFRIYGTCLTADDVKNLYNTTASLDNKNNLHGLFLQEKQQNVMWQSSLGLSCQQDSCLRRYTQSYCAVTHTPQGAHIVRTPNIEYTGSGNNTYGGIVFRNTTVGSAHVWNSQTDNIWNLQKNHRYLFVCHLKGYSANDLGWITISNSVGWGSGGLVPEPTTNASYFGPSLASAGAAGLETDIWRDFTITDDIVKTCTTSYSSFVAGNKYLSYCEIGVGFTYGATSTLGTDVYISNPRLYDITNLSKNNFYANGTINFSQFIENNNLESISITHGNEILTNSIIER